MNVALVLTAMAADYYPRLSSLGNQPDAQRRLVDDQLHVALLLGGPLILALMAAPPLAVMLLYSGQFDGAVSILRWQVIGDLLKIPGWATGYVLLARNDRRAFAWCEITFALLSPITVALLFPMMGIAAAGAGYALAYAGYSVTVLLTVGRRYGLHIVGRNLVHLMALLAACGVLFLIATRSAGWALGIGGLAALLLAGFAARAFRRG